MEMSHFEYGSSPSGGGQADYIDILFAPAYGSPVPPSTYSSRYFTKETHYAKEFAEPLAPFDPLFPLKEAVPLSGIAFGVVRYFGSAEQSCLYSHM